jgi:hypothetical protein
MGPGGIPDDIGPGAPPPGGIGPGKFPGGPPGGPAEGPEGGMFIEFIPGFGLGPGGPLTKPGRFIIRLEPGPIDIFGFPIIGLFIFGPLIPIPIKLLIGPPPIGLILFMFGF